MLWKSSDSYSTRKIHFESILTGKNCLFDLGQNVCPRQFQFCLGQNLLDKNFVQGEKDSFFLSKYFQNDFSWLDISFLAKRVILNDFLEQKINLLAMDKNYVLDNFYFVLDKMTWTKLLSGQKNEALDLLNYLHFLLFL